MPHANAPTDLDSFLFGEGTHQRLYDTLGAHLTTQGGVTGVSFTVWAPNAARVYVMGDFNGWNGISHPMQRDGHGFWTTFVPHLHEHTVYKYRIVAANGDSFDKADPCGFQMEQRPRTGSVVANLERYQWQDLEWIQRRAAQQALDQPLSIYEVHLGSWRKKADPEWGSRYLTYRELADELIPYVLEMGFTHIEVLPITEYPFDASWGYQVLGFYAPTSRYGTPQDLMYFIDRCHQAGLGVLLDWVPAHFPRDGAGLNFFDGTHLYSNADPRRGEQPDWGTLLFDYSRPEVRSFLISNALFWIEKYHFDGLRLDAVSSMLYLDYSREAGEWIPNEYGGRENLGAIQFLRQLNDAVHHIFPGALTIAEEATSWPHVTGPTSEGGLGFDLKWNMGWMHDTLRYMKREPVHRRYHQNDLTFGLIYAFDEKFVLPLSHDEVVHLKKSILERMPGDDWQQFANLRAYYAFMWTHPGKKLLFMGGEFGQRREWDFANQLEWDSLKSHWHRNLQRCVADLQKLYRSHPALYERDFTPDGFQWIDNADAESSVISYVRRAANGTEHLLIVCNFTPVPRPGYRVGAPQAGSYREIFNSDSQLYSGSSVGNHEPIATDNIPWQNQPHSIVVTLPPLATIVLQPSD